jgi:hypothetical protein
MIKASPSARVSRSDVLDKHLHTQRTCMMWSLRDTEIIQIKKRYQSILDGFWRRSAISPSMEVLRRASSNRCANWS